VCGAVWIDVGEFPQTVWSVVWCDQAAFEVFKCFPFRVDGVGVTDVEIHTGGCAEGIVVGPLVEVDRHRPAVGKTIAIWTFVGMGVKSEPAVAGKGHIQVSNSDDRRHRGEANFGHTAVCHQHFNK
jgi:hypothetical protein